MTIDELLSYVQRTNPDMTKEKLIEELDKSDYSARGLIYIANCQNFKNILGIFLYPPMF